MNSLGGFKLGRPGLTRRAMTLVEVLVVSAILVVVLGLAYEAAQSSSRATDAISGRQQALVACQRAEMLAARTLEKAIAPSNLTGASASKASPVFKRQGMTVYALDAGGERLERVVIDAPAAAPATAAAATPSSVRAASPCLLTRSAVDASGGAQSASQPIFGANDIPGYRLELSFAYANAPDPGQEPAWRDDWPAGQWPDLALIRARAVSRVAGARAVELVTAVVPGGVHGTPASAPAAGKEAKP
jgi:prepilin-type N-terminal cleavage/methylation domain-containing protein